MTQFLKKTLHSDVHNDIIKLNIYLIIRIYSQNFEVLWKFKIQISFGKLQQYYPIFLNYMKMFNTLQASTSSPANDCLFDTYIL